MPEMKFVGGERRHLTVKASLRKRLWASPALMNEIVGELGILHDGVVTVYVVFLARWWSINV